LHELGRTGAPRPTIVPTVRGGVQFEWHTQGLYLEIELSTPEQASIFFEDAKESREWEADLTSGLAQLTGYLAELWPSAPMAVASVNSEFVVSALESLIVSDPSAEKAPPSLSPEERAARVDAAVGVIAHSPGSVDDFLRRKQEEIDLEEAIWERRRRGEATAPLGLCPIRFIR
jgi:hypothetical protein